MIKVAFFAPYIQPGSSSDFMQGLIHYWQNVECIGVAVENTPKESFHEVAVELADAADLVIDWSENNPIRSDMATLPIVGFDVDDIPQNGFDPGRVAPYWGRPIRRDRWGVDDDDRVILFRGDFDQRNHPDLILHALQMLGDKWHAVFNGSGEMQQELIRLARETAPNRVHFDVEETPGDALAAADVFCLPTDFTGNLLPIYEAMAAGLPIVSTGFDGLVELENRHNIRICERVQIPPTAEQIAEAAIFATSAAYKSDIVEDARRVAWENYGLPHLAAKWEWLILETVHQFNRARAVGRTMTIAP